METLAIFRREDIGDDEAKSFDVRRAVRGVVLDADMNVVILFATKGMFHTLPGGAVEEGETDEKAFIRECKEEICCDVEILAPLGKTLEYRKTRGINESHGFVARVVGEKGEFIPTGDEFETGAELKWIPIHEAIELLGAFDNSIPLYAQYVMEREIVFLKKAQKVLNK